MEQQAWIDQAWDKINAAQAAVTPAAPDAARGLDRATYEAACYAADVPTLADSEIDTYGVKYGDWLQVTVEPVLAAQMTVAGWRLQRIEHERKAGYEAAQAEADAIEAAQARTAQQCLACGHPATMIASLGPACDDHYDDLSG